MALDKWAEAAHLTSGVYFHPVNKRDVVGPGPLSTQAIWKLVVSYREVLPAEGKAKLIAPTICAAPMPSWRTKAMCPWSRFR